MHMTDTKKLAVFHDMSGYGRCSLTVALPVISALGVQGCPIPTAVLSNHLGFPVWFERDLTEDMPAYIQKWQELSLQFDGVLIGYLAGSRQMEIVTDFAMSLKETKTEDNLERKSIESTTGNSTEFQKKMKKQIFLDPVMGDHGRLYSSCTDEFVRKMKQLAAASDVIMPNLTEACFLTDTPYQNTFSRKQLQEIGGKLLAMGPSSAVITGIAEGTFLSNLVCEKTEQDRTSHISWVKKKKSGENRPGTGDIFSAVVAAGMLEEHSLCESVVLAAEFIRRAVKRSETFKRPIQEGVCFEKELAFLLKKQNSR